MRTYPQLELHQRPGQPVEVRTTKPDTVTITYEWSTDILEPRRWTPFSQTSDITISGQVVLDNGKVIWTR